MWAPAAFASICGGKAPLLRLNGERWRAFCFQQHNGIAVRSSRNNNNDVLCKLIPCRLRQAEIPMSPRDLHKFATLYEDPQVLAILRVVKQVIRCFPNDRNAPMSAQSKIPLLKRNAAAIVTSVSLFTGSRFGRRCG